MGVLCSSPTVLSPPKDLVRASAFPSAHRVVGVARAALIDRTRTTRRVPGYVLSDLEQPEGLDEVAAVITSPVVDPSVIRPAAQR